MKRRLDSGQSFIGLVALNLYAGDGLIDTGVYAGFRWDGWAFIGFSERVDGQYTANDLGMYKTSFNTTSRDIHLKFDVIDGEMGFWVRPEGDESPEFPQVTASVPAGFAREGKLGTWSAQNVAGNRSIPIAYKYFAALPTPYATLIRGDFDENFVVNAADIDLLSSALRTGSSDLKFDINLDNQVDAADRTFWVEDERRTYFGDANLDGEFNSADFVHVFQAGQYEDSVPGNSTWSSDDWDGNGEFTSGDFVVAFQTGGYEKGPRPSLAAVPEPNTVWLVGIALLSLTPTRRRC
jgi:hypothetical protein